MTQVGFSSFASASQWREFIVKAANGRTFDIIAMWIWVIEPKGLDYKTIRTEI